MGGFNRVRLPACMMPSVCVLIRVMKKLPLIVEDGAVEARRGLDIEIEQVFAKEMSK